MVDLLPCAGKSMTFKTTMKGLNKLGQITMGDLGIHLLTFVALVVSLGIGLHKLLAGPTVVTTLAISVVWIIYAMIPIWLLIWYTFLGRGTSLHMWCRCALSCPPGWCLQAVFTLPLVGTFQLRC